MQKFIFGDINMEYPTLTHIFSINVRLAAYYVSNNIAPYKVIRILR